MLGSLINPGNEIVDSNPGKALLVRDRSAVAGEEIPRVLVSSVIRRVKREMANGDNESVCFVANGRCVTGLEGYETIR